MSFDPEKASRFYDVECCGNSGMSDAQYAPPSAEIYVRASDYDKLLELYRVAQVNYRPLCSHGCIEGQCAICK